jgi:NAD(P)-dependent dehydrogenase (short-subunit alcohol dehydrogenase family)
MVIVAIAGGNGGVGRAICDALQEFDKYKGFVLTRKVYALKIRSIAMSFWAKFIEVPEAASSVHAVQVDYTDVAGLTKIYEHLEIHTIISTFHIFAPSLSISQLNLIKAAEA